MKGSGIPNQWLDVVDGRNAGIVQLGECQRFSTEMDRFQCGKQIPPSKSWPNTRLAIGKKLPTFTSTNHSRPLAQRNRQETEPSFPGQFPCRHVVERRALPSVLMHQALSCLVAQRAFLEVDLKAELHLPRSADREDTRADADA